MIENSDGSRAPQHALPDGAVAAVKDTAHANWQLFHHRAQRLQRRELGPTGKTDYGLTYTFFPYLQCTAAATLQQVVRGRRNLYAAFFWDKTVATDSQAVGFFYIDRKFPIPHAVNKQRQSCRTGSAYTLIKQCPIDGVGDVE